MVFKAAFFSAVDIQPIYIWERVLGPFFKLSPVNNPWWGLKMEGEAGWVNDVWTHLATLKTFIRGQAMDGRHRWAMCWDSWETSTLTSRCLMRSDKPQRLKNMVKEFLNRKSKKISATLGRFLSHYPHIMEFTNLTYTFLSQRCWVHAMKGSVTVCLPVQSCMNWSLCVDVCIRLMGETCNCIGRGGAVCACKFRWATHCRLIC